MATGVLGTQFLRGEPMKSPTRCWRRVARENAKQKLWPLLGYELKTKLASI